MNTWKRKSLCLFILFSVACVLPRESKSAPSRQVDGYRLIQQSTLAGLLTVRMCVLGTRIDSEQSGFVYLTRPKTSTITVLNSKSHKYCVVPIEGWKPPYSITALVKGDGFMDLRTVNVLPGREGSLKTEIVRLKTIRHFSGKPKNHREGLIVTNATAVVTRALPAGPETWKVCSRLIGLPDLNGYPLSEGYTNRLEISKQDFHTTSVATGKLDSGDFAIPAGFKATSKLEEVYLGADSGASFKDLIEGL